MAIHMSMVRDEELGDDHRLCDIVRYRPGCLAPADVVFRGAGHKPIQRREQGGDLPVRQQLGRHAERVTDVVQSIVNGRGARPSCGRA